MRINVEKDAPWINFCLRNIAQYQDYSPVPKVKHLEFMIDLQITLNRQLEWRLAWMCWKDNYNLNFKERLNRLINNYCHESRRFTVALANNHEELNDINHCTRIRQFYDSVKQYEKLVNTMNQALLGKKSNLLEFKVVEPLSICIQVKIASHWQNASLDLSNSNTFVNIGKILYQWYKNGNVSIELRFEVIHVRRAFSVFDIKNENWIKLIVKMMNKEFMIGDNCDVDNSDYNECDLFFVGQYDRLSKMHQRPQRISIVLSVCIHRHCRN